MFPSERLVEIPGAKSDIGGFFIDTHYLKDDITDGKTCVQVDNFNGDLAMVPGEQGKVIVITEDMLCHH